MMEMDVTQVVEGLGAGGIVPQSFFVELCSLFIVLLHKHSVSFVDESGGVVAISRHGEVSVSVSLVIIFLL